MTFIGDGFAICAWCGAPVTYDEYMDVVNDPDNTCPKCGNDFYSEETK